MELTLAPYAMQCACTHAFAMVLHAIGVNAYYGPRVMLLTRARAGRNAYASPWLQLAARGSAAVATAREPAPLPVATELWATRHQRPRYTIATACMCMCRAALRARGGSGTWIPSALVGLRVAPASPAGHGRLCGRPRGRRPRGDLRSRSGPGPGGFRIFSCAPPWLWPLAYALRAHVHLSGACRRSGSRSRSDSSAHSGTRHCPWGAELASRTSWSVSATGSSRQRPRRQRARARWPPQWPPPAVG